MGVLRMGVLVTGCPKKNPYDSHPPKLVPKLITADQTMRNSVLTTDRRTDRQTDTDKLPLLRKAP